MIDNKQQPECNPLNERHNSTKFRLSDNGFSYIYDGTLEELIKETGAVEAFEFLGRLNKKITADK